MNNAIQNANDLSRINKHNLRDYDRNKKLIRIIYGTDNIITDEDIQKIKKFTKDVKDMTEKS